MFIALRDLASVAKQAKKNHNIYQTRTLFA
jgi:hypothetical protein